MLNNLFGDYGGIELKRNAEKNTYLGFTYSVGFHAMLVLLYVGWSWMSDKNDSKTDGSKKYASIFIDMPPLLSSPDPNLGSPKIRSSNPRLGIPIPISDVQIQDQIMPMNDLGIPGTSDHGTIGDSLGTSKGKENKLTTTSVIQSDIKHPDKDVFLLVDEDAHPQQNIQSLIVYPETARHAALEGQVIYSALIGTDGRVIKVDIEKSEYDLFKQPVIEALMKTHFTPARQGQTPVESWYSGTVSFKLSAR